MALKINLRLVQFSVSTSKHGHKNGVSADARKSLRLVKVVVGRDVALLVVVRASVSEGTAAPLLYPCIDSVGCSVSYFYVVVEGVDAVKRYRKNTRGGVEIWARQHGECAGGSIFAKRC